MRKIILAIWLLIPVAGAAYHFGPGQERLNYDHIYERIAEAESHVEQQQWKAASESYDQALALVPSEDTETSQSIRLERAKTQMFASQLPQAHDELEKLIEELEAKPEQNPQVLASARDSLANAKYYMTWLMRLEGQPREKWEPIIESARQNYRLLAEQNKDTKKAAENLEASIRLARLDINDLQGLPLPSQ